MAEYIDRDKVLEFSEKITTDDYSGNETLDVVLTEEICGLVPADVIERSKIDKAIEEIKEKSYLSYDDNPRRVLDEECVLEILKRNIGEDGKNDKERSNKAIRNQ